MAFGKSKEELIQIFESEDFLKILKNNINEYTLETSFKNLKKSYNSLKREIVDYSTDKAALELKNDKNVVLFFIHFSWVFNRFFIDECFSLDANKYIDITEKKPLDLNLNNLINQNNRIYYDDDKSNEIYELRFWPLIVEELKSDLLNRIHIEDGENYKTIINDRENNFLQDYFYFENTEIGHKSNYWNFDRNKYGSHYENGLVSIGAFAEYNHFRELYSEWTLSATFNVKTAEIIIKNSSFDKWNYK